MAEQITTRQARLNDIAFFGTSRDISAYCAVHTRTRLVVIVYRSALATSCWSSLLCSKDIVRLGPLRVWQLLNAAARASPQGKVWNSITSAPFTGNHRW